MGVNIDEILQSLEQEKTAEANFADNLNTETPIEDTSNVEYQESVEITDDEMAKIAAECDAQGRIMARSFVNEINKIAADDYDGGTYAEEDGVEEAPQAPAHAEAEKVAEEFTPQERIIGNLYNNYFGGEE